MSEHVIRLERPVPCSVHPALRTIAYHAYVSGDLHSPVCERCMIVMSDMNSDNADFYGPALADIRERRHDFVRLMRRPDAEPMRTLLVYLKTNEGVDWRGISGLELDKSAPDPACKCEMCVYYRQEASPLAS